MSSQGSLEPWVAKNRMMTDNPYLWPSDIKWHNKGSKRVLNKMCWISINLAYQLRHRWATYLKLTNVCKRQPPSISNSNIFTLSFCEHPKQLERSNTIRKTIIGNGTREGVKLPLGENCPDWEQLHNGPYLIELPMACIGR